VLRTLVMIVVGAYLPTIVRTLTGRRQSGDAED
jgi:hypothetical protein